MKQQELQKGDVVQISPKSNSAFQACFMIVTEPKTWGAQGYVSMPTVRNQPPDLAYYRASWDEMEYIGKAWWMQGEIFDDGAQTVS